MATTEDPRQSTPTDRWRDERYAAAPERQGELFSTMSGIENEPLVTPDTSTVDYERDLGYPGAFPFTRGVYPVDVPRSPLDDAPVRGLRDGG